MAIDLGFVSIRLYSICILIGIVLGYFLITKEASKHGYKKEDVSNLLFYSILVGIIGARLYYCVFNLDYYLDDPLSMFMVWQGGLAIHGGIIFGGITAFIYAKNNNMKILPILDYMVVGLILAQAIGRWGNFFNGEAHGGITTLSYLKSIHLPKFIIDGMYIDGNYYIPTFLYESLWCLLGFIIMFLVRNKKFVKVGYLTGFYFVWYGTQRFFVEGLRTDSLMFLNFRIAQIISIIMILLGIFVFIFSYRRNINYVSFRGDKND
ncbi:MAG: prolipoprotein diacylglyceryl transferase [Bacilli bacterium]|nr:prolipoprotein diacylglyceryl transferase [Bacilli bacterium]